MAPSARSSRLEFGSGEGESVAWRSVAAMREFAKAVASSTVKKSKVCVEIWPKAGRRLFMPPAVTGFVTCYLFEVAERFSTDFQWW